MSKQPFDRDTVRAWAREHMRGVANVVTKLKSKRLKVFI